MISGHHEERRIVVDIEAVFVFEDGIAGSRHIFYEFTAQLQTVVKPEVEQNSGPGLSVVAAAGQVPVGIPTDHNVRGRVITESGSPLAVLLACAVD
jgi:hypothetical protein